ncbi:unnamed protein product [Urochloa humidicola]
MHVREDPRSCDQYWVSTSLYLNHLKQEFPQVYAAYMQSSGFGSAAATTPTLVHGSRGSIPSHVAEGNDLNQQLNDLKCSHFRLKTDFYDFKLKNDEFKATFSEYKNDVAAHYTELKNDFGNVKNEFGNVKNEFGNLKNEFEVLQTCMGNKKDNPWSWGATIVAVVVVVIGVMVAVSCMFPERK